MTLDADVLLAPGSIAALLAFAEHMPKHFFQAQGRIFDKLTGKYRPAGHRIYRTELLELALKHIPQPGCQLRPEQYVVNRMGELGFPERRCGLFIGLHDFEQKFTDVYRKSVVHAVKHTWLLPDMISRCVASRALDTDFDVVLKGLWDGLIMDQPITIDSKRFEAQSAAAIGALALGEKEPLRALVSSDVTGIIDEVLKRKPPDEFASFDIPPLQAFWHDKIRQRFARRGIFGGSVAALGISLKMMGAQLRNIGSRLDA